VFAVVAIVRTIRCRAGHFTRLAFKMATKKAIKKKKPIITFSSDGAVKFCVRLFVFRILLHRDVALAQSPDDRAIAFDFGRFNCFRPCYHRPIEKWSHFLVLNNDRNPCEFDVCSLGSASLISKV
jgi:hypothetical protein